MNRRDFFWFGVTVFLVLWCIQLHQRIGLLNSQLTEWEEDRFEMTRVLSDLQKNVFRLFLKQRASGGKIFPETSSALELNKIGRQDFSKAFFKYAGRLKLMALSMQFPEDEKSHHYSAATANELDKKFPDIWPTDGTITSLFGLRKHPILKTFKFHRGVDIANLKNTEILAAADGKVEFAGSDGGYGNTVILNHGNGFETIYGHADDLLVKVGESISKGQLIASMGSTGLSTGNHLHYEIKFSGEPIDPTLFVK